ncbi:MAG: WXG100 family type VII secretion target [Lachnospiraceae bacterium]|nr:WXG100 family type VII secretion target [Lachnospiraceae bacterium]
MGADSLKMSYEDMQAEIARLSQYADEFENTTSSMTSSVTTLCDGWTSASTETYREDYTALANNFSQTLEVVRSLIQSTSDYIADMQAVDSAYSKSKVSVR